MKGSPTLAPCATFETACTALEQLAGRQDFTFKTEDFMGPPPRAFDLRAALTELEGRTGQDGIKREVRKLVASPR